MTRLRKKFKALEIPLDTPMEQARKLRELIKEANRLRSSLLAKIPADQKSKGVVLSCLFPGVSSESLKALNHESDFNGWLVMDLEEDELSLLKDSQGKWIKNTESCIENDVLMADPLIALDSTSFNRQLKNEIDRIASSDLSLSLAFIELNQDSNLNAWLTFTLKSLVKIKRGFDTVGVIDENRLGLILPGLGFYRSEHILECLRDILEEKARSCGEDLVFSCGLSNIKGYMNIKPSQLCKITEKALMRAKNLPKGGIERAQVPELSHSVKKTLVEAQEKQFLFFGPTKGTV